MLRDLALLFLRVGNTTFGGGDPTIAVLEREFRQRRWLSVEQFSLVYALARVTPGTNLLAFCAGSAWSIAGVAGAVVAVLAVTAPSAILVVYLTEILIKGSAVPTLRNAVAGTIAAAAGIMAGVALLLLRSQARSSGAMKAGAIFALCFGLARLTPLSPLQVLIVAAAIGFLWPRP